jgi:hypothetical protein
MEEVVESLDLTLDGAEAKAKIAPVKKARKERRTKAQIADDLRIRKEVNDARNTTNPPATESAPPHGKVWAE